MKTNEYSLRELAEKFPKIDRFPFSLRILLENVLRHCDGKIAAEEHLHKLAKWNPEEQSAQEIPFMPARVLLQDFTGVPCVADLAAVRDAVKKRGGNPDRINPLIPVDLVIDHSIQVDAFGSPAAFDFNLKKEYERNKERYLFLRWAQNAFHNFRVVPPETGICHQVNLEYFAKVVQSKDGADFPDTVVGADSHTTMINGLGVLGWGVGGIEAEACMLGQPYFLIIPQVVGFKLTGRPEAGVTATDLVLTVTQMLRKKGVVGKFVEFYGSGLDALTLPNRATVANMAPEYGATVAYFPVDQETLRYLRATNRDEALVKRVENYTKAQGLFRTSKTPDPLFSDTLELDLGTLEPSLAGPRRPQDRIPLSEMKSAFNAQNETPHPPVEIPFNREKVNLRDGSVVISAITSCTNTSNPNVMIAAGLLAKNAVEAGLSTAPAVKTSLAPGSAVVTEYLKKSELLPYLEKLGFHVVGYGCTTCIGNSGPLPAPIAEAVKKNDLSVAAVLSGNRNFDGRINPSVKLAYLASPPLVVAFALAGRVDIDLTAEPIGKNKKGAPVFLRDLWPSNEAIESVIRQSLTKELFAQRYAHLLDGDPVWKSLKIPSGAFYDWDPESTYIHPPPFLEDNEPPGDIMDARVLVMAGDSVTTDHISPAGSIPADSPAGRYLVDRGVSPSEFNSFGSRRGNHEVMVRGTFGNIRLKNFLTPGKEGNWTRFFPDETVMSIYDASVKYRRNKTPLMVLAGKEYGAGSSRDWAAKGPKLLGVKGVIAESFERIHRSNLVGMGILPLQFKPGESWKNLGLTGQEIYSIDGISGRLKPNQEFQVRADSKTFSVVSRLDSQIDIDYYQSGGILPYVLNRLLL